MSQIRPTEAAIYDRPDQRLATRSGNTTPRDSDFLPPSKWILTLPSAAMRHRSRPGTGALIPRPTTGIESGFNSRFPHKLPETDCPNRVSRGTKQCTPINWLGNEQHCNLHAHGLAQQFVPLSRAPRFDSFLTPCLQQDLKTPPHQQTPVPTR